ncbi:hypothetical protein PEX1_056690 [Penicillium expansum]|uniref:Fungal N-terminal domain-containing protein n=1 Tax=Penicillium expansum TaxID=27334 RepID=A0A0A2IWN5_PENEN|nr:hypothetical protein PEX2_091010 [Penicillium expansum]KGO42060.1 hypothetical protein PEX1_056690 [Penicillium expansum]KGO46911.1 hypothetical protein PEXP_066010 [Penicillium expansum]KGO58723.1 hypothetical protein PEX2_091010 [Penicillium expansum]
MDPLSITANVLALLETSINITGRLRIAYSSSLLKQHHEELQRTESVIRVVHSEGFLETEAVTSELNKLKNLSQELLTLLERLDSGKKSIPRQIAYQLANGSQDEEHLAKIVERMNTVKTNIILHVQVAGVGLTRDGQSIIAANAAKISQLGRTVRELLGDGQGLRITSLMKDQPLREGGTPILDSDDLNQIGVSIRNGGTTRTIIGNLTRPQALQINGPVGKDEWKTISHLEIRDNEAGPASSQVNYPVSGIVFASLLFDHAIKYVLLFVLIYLVF